MDVRVVRFSRAQQTGRSSGFWSSLSVQARLATRIESAARGYAERDDADAGNKELVRTVRAAQSMVRLDGMRCRYRRRGVVVVVVAEEVQRTRRGFPFLSWLVLEGNFVDDWRGRREEWWWCRWCRWC